MSREIKFRGKRYKHLQHGDNWVYGDFYHSTDRRCCIDQWVVKEKTVGQYTGLKDKNGVEIFEGDIVTTNRMPKVIKWVDELAGYTLSMSGAERCKVIGNIHENPELPTT